MIRNMTRFAPLLALAALLLACGDDKEAKPKKRTLGFAQETVTFNEADGTVEIEVTLDKPALTDVTIDFSISGGTARDLETAEDENLFADYEILNDDFEIEVEEGETIGIIEIDLFSDLLLENAETIVIKMEEPSSGEIILGDQNEITVNIEQEHGLYINVGWIDDYDGDGITANDEGDDNHPDSVDLDLFMWIEDDDGEYTLMGDFLEEGYPFLGREEFLYEGDIYLFTTNLLGSKYSPEYVFIPSVALPDGNYAVGCTYYNGPAGQETPFDLDFIEINGATEVSKAHFEPTYTDANINKYTSLSTVKYVATFSKDGDSYSDFDFTTPESGSRATTFTLPAGIKKVYDRKVPAHVIRQAASLKRLQ
jgi:hypothetical protein